MKEVQNTSHVLRIASSAYLIIPCKSLLSVAVTCSKTLPSVCLFPVSDISGSIRNFCHTQNSGTKHKFEMEQIQPKFSFSVRKRGVKRAKKKKERICHLRRRDPLYWGERWARRKGREGKKCLITISECERRGMRVETTRLSNFSHFSFFFFFLYFFFYPSRCSLTLPCPCLQSII